MPSVSVDIDHTFALRLPLRILVVEDNPVNRRLARHMLERLGYAPDLVETGREAVAAARSTPYDLVLMDIYLPDINGFDAARQIAESATDATRPTILATTAERLTSTVSSASAIDDVLLKPIRFDDLQAKLKRWGPRRTEPSSAGPLIDVEVFMLLRSTLGDDPAFFQDLLDSFEHQSQGLLHSLRDALARQEADTLRRTINTLKDSGLNLGARALADLCTVIEADATAERFDRLPDLLDQLETRHRQSVERLRALL